MWNIIIQFRLLEKKKNDNNNRKQISYKKQFQINMSEKKKIEFECFVALKILFKFNYPSKLGHP